MMMRQKKSELLPLLKEISACRLCAAQLPHAPKPVLSAASGARLLIVGQAPGRRVQQSGIPWSDASGATLRSWLGLSERQFYDADKIAILPMGFCYPGTGPHGDLPPRRECAPQWHARLLDEMPDIRLTLLIGSYAQAGYLQQNAKKNLTETVAHYADYLPRFFPLPHPSPRNRHWQSRHPWFASEVLPQLKLHVRAVLESA